jgi:SAM-dependent methyltransferase
MYEISYIKRNQCSYITHSQSETASLTSSITNYRFENGRRYHAYKDGKYWGPNDEGQNDQLEIANHIFLLLFDGALFQAPLGPNTKEVLDIGTGTGVWAIDFADQFPAASVTGTDLSPIQPTWTPPNCRFEIDDCTEEWTFCKNSFDFIHVRSLYGSIADWPAFYRQVYAHLKPGGWYEQVEYSVDWKTDDDSIPSGHIFHEASARYVEAGEKMGKTFRIVDLQKEYVLQAGLVNVVEKRYKMPLGPWSAEKKQKEIGRWHLLEAYQGIEGWTMALFTRILGWSAERVHVFLVGVRDGFKDRNIHAYTSVSVVYGQKPLE